MSSKNSVRPVDRVSALRLQQTLKMARSAHAYVRGSTVKFYEWLEVQKRGTLPEGPPVWIYAGIAMPATWGLSPQSTAASRFKFAISTKP